MLKAELIKDNTTNYTDSELFHWRDLLENRKKELLASEEALKKQAISELDVEETGEISKIRLHPADLATNTQQIQMLRTISEKNIRNLQEVEEALDRIDNGRYGLCVMCEEAIPKERLELVPEARYCFECKEDLEKQHKLH